MHPTSFKETNKIFSAGNNPNTEDLAVCICVNPEMTEGTLTPFVVSRWKLSPEEIELVKERGEIWISIMGYGMPPILPMVLHPFEEMNFEPLEF